MTLILTNDDGIDAPGLRALQQTVQAIGEQAVIVAPQQHHSGCSHQVTTHRPIRVEKRSDTEYAVDGTPVDCVRIALSYLCLNASLVLSGINAGGNMGADVYISGTVAAAREATLNRIPGIAISHYIHQRRAIDWQQATAMTIRVLEQLRQIPLSLGSFWNVNLPHLESDLDTKVSEPEITFCSLCTQPLPAVYQLLETGSLQYGGEYSKRRRDPGSDVETCFAGKIAVTQIQLWGQPVDQAPERAVDQQTEAQSANNVQSGSLSIP